MKSCWKLRVGRALAVQARLRVPLFALLFVSALGVNGGCGSTKTGCVPGQSIACSLGGCEGHQVCRADGSAYDACVCSGPEDGDFPKAGPHSGLIGAACASSADCRSGFECLTRDSKLVNGEGPSGGICLARCLPEHDFCKQLDARSRCIVLYDGGTSADKLDDVAYCLPGCELGTQPNDEDKCRSRIDLVCAESPAGSGAGFCRPACRSDVDCGERHCDLGTGLCGDTAFAGGAIGAACSGPQAATCAGGCIDHGSSYAECSGVCRYGTAGCGQEDQDAPLDYFCYLDPTTTGAGDGDLGYCARLCDCDDDCGRKDAVCEPRGSLEDSTGRTGVCGSRTYANGDPRANTPC